MSCGAARGPAGGAPSGERCGGTCGAATACRDSGAVSSSTPVRRASTASARVRASIISRTPAGSSGARSAPAALQPSMIRCVSGRSPGSLRRHARINSLICGGQAS
jgi:hypothetical protein